MAKWYLNLRIPEGSTGTRAPNSASGEVGYSILLTGPAFQYVDRPLPFSSLPAVASHSPTKLSKFAGPGIEPRAATFSGTWQPSD